MAINFPDSPSTNDTYTVNGRTYIWNGEKWLRAQPELTSVVPTLTVSNNLTVDTDTLHVDAGTNTVGINNLTPTYTLDVSGSDGGALRLSEDSSSPSTLVLSHTDGSYWALSTGGSDTAEVANGELSFYDGNATSNPHRLLIDSSGRVGIGTTTPDEKLTVTDGHVLFEAATDSGTVNIVSKTNATNAGNKIAFFAADRHDVDEEMAYIRPYLQTNSGGSGNVQLGHLTFGTSGFERMRINSSGNVGIGTSTPTYPLDVEDSTAAIVSLNDSGGTVGAGTNSRVIFEAGGSTAGEVGFLNTGSGILSLKNNDGAIYLTTASADGILFRPNTTEAMRITSDGNVGIGTTGPLQKLHVNGMILADMGDLGYGFERSGTQSSWALRKGGTGALSGDAVRIGNVNNNYLEFWTNNTRHGFMRSDGALYMTAVYGDTNAAGANMVILSSGQIMRSNSSAKYKTDIETIDEEHADIIFDLRPVWYRSSTGNEPEGYSFYGLIAEEVAEVDPRLVHFGSSPDCSCVAPEGEHLEHTKECLSEPEGVQYDRLVPHLISVAQRQQAHIDALTSRIEALEAN